MSYPVENGSQVKNLDSLANINNNSYTEFRNSFSSLPDNVVYAINNIFNKEGGFNSTKFSGKQGDSYVFENENGKQVFINVSAESPSIAVQEAGPQLKMPAGLENESFAKGENQHFNADPASNKGFGIGGGISGSAGSIKGNFYKINEDGSAYKSEGQFSVLEAHGNASVEASKHGLSPDVQIGGNFFKTDGSLTTITKPEPVFDYRSGEVVMEQKEFGVSAGANVGANFSIKSLHPSLEAGIHGGFVNEEFSTPVKDIVSSGELENIEKEGLVNTQRENEIKVLNDGMGGTVQEIQHSTQEAVDARYGQMLLNNYKEQNKIEINEVELSGSKENNQGATDRSFGWNIGEELASFGHFLGIETSTLRFFGMDPEQLSEAGYDIKNITSAGYSVKEFEEAGLTSAMLIEKGAHAEDLTNIGFNVKDIVGEGVSADMLLKAGFSEEEISHAISSSNISLDGNITNNNTEDNDADTSNAGAFSNHNVDNNASSNYDGVVPLNHDIQSATGADPDEDEEASTGVSAIVEGVSESGTSAEVQEETESNNTDSQTETDSSSSNTSDDDGETSSSIYGEVDNTAGTGTSSEEAGEVNEETPENNFSNESDTDSGASQNTSLDDEPPNDLGVAAPDGEDGSTATTEANENIENLNQGIIEGNGEEAAEDNNITPADIEETDDNTEANEALITGNDDDDTEETSVNESNEVQEEEPETASVEQNGEGSTNAENEEGTESNNEILQSGETEQDESNNEESLSVINGTDDNVSDLSGEESQSISNVEQENGENLEEPSESWNGNDENPDGNGEESTVEETGEEVEGEVNPQENESGIENTFIPSEASPQETIEENNNYSSSGETTQEEPESGSDTSSYNPDSSIENTSQYAAEGENFPENATYQQTTEATTDDNSGYEAVEDNSGYSTNDVPVEDTSAYAQESNTTESGSGEAAVYAD